MRAIFHSNSPSMISSLSSEPIGLATTACTSEVYIEADSGGGAGADFCRSGGGAGDGSRYGCV